VDASTGLSKRFMRGICGTWSSFSIVENVVTGTWKKNKRRESVEWVAIPFSRTRLTRKYVTWLTVLTNRQTGGMFSANTRSTFNANVVSDFQNIVEPGWHSVGIRLNIRQVHGRTLTVTSTSRHKFFLVLTKPLRRSCCTVQSILAQGHKLLYL
jgi:hypothetical protein